MVATHRVEVYLIRWNEYRICNIVFLPEQKKAWLLRPDEKGNIQFYVKSYKCWRSGPPFINMV